MSTTIQKNKAISMIEMLFTSICHDLSGVIGAIGNASEIIDIENINKSKQSIQQQAFSLLKNSSNDAINRIIMFRNAYASTNDQSESNILDYCSNFSDFMTNKNIKINITSASSDMLTQKTYVARITLNILLLMHSCISSKESIKIKINKKEENTVINVLCTTNGTISIDPKIINSINKKENEITVQTAQAHFLASLAEEFNCELRVSLGDKAFEFSAIFGNGFYSSTD